MTEMVWAREKKNDNEGKREEGESVTEGESPSVATDFVLLYVEQSERREINERRCHFENSLKIDIFNSIVSLSLFN